MITRRQAPKSPRPTPETERIGPETLAREETVLRLTVRTASRRPLSRRRRDIIPTRTEFKALKDWLDVQIEDSDRPTWIHLLMRLACSTGMRLGELIQIKWERGPEDIGTGHARNYVYLHREEKTLTIKFKRKLRVIPASHVWGVFETLWKRRKEGRPHVFTSPNGGHYDDSYVCRLWKKKIPRR